MNYGSNVSLATDSYSDAASNKRGLRGAISDAVSGIKSIFGRSPDQQAADEEQKTLNTWTKEIELAEAFFKDYETDGVRCAHAFLDESVSGYPDRAKYRLNLFHSNITTLISIMYAKLPKVEADRRFADPNDDVARVASEMITRILQNDMNDPEDKLANVLRQTLQDRLISGLGAARVRYCLEEDGAGEAAVKKDEWCDIEYIHWRDILWSPCRTPAEMRWVAFRVYMTKGEVTARFGKDVAGVLPYASRGPKLDPSDAKVNEVSQHQDAAQAEIWEIWDKASKRVYWFVKGFSKFLDVREDPLSLAGFFPNAQSMVANATTLKYLPKPDYLMAEALYDEINELETRIGLLTKACKAVGVYPSSATEIKTLMSGAVENQLVPIDNWAMFADKGGLKGQIEWVPIKEIAETLQILVIQQQTRINQLYQVTGMSDIIRGQASQSGVTATEQRIKAQFASTRMQSFQDEFANFAADLLNRKVEIIRQFYDHDRILRLSNIANTPDAEFAEKAISLIKDKNAFDCRVSVKAESMAQLDYESLKMERSEFMGAVATFLGSAAPLLEKMPTAAPFLLELLKFNLAGMKGANQMEGVIDRAVAELLSQQQKDAENPQPSPEEKAAQIETEGKIKVEAAKAQAKGQADQQKAAIEAQTLQQEHAMEMTRMQNEMQMDRETHALEMEKLQAQIQLLFAKLGFERESQQLELQGQQQEQALEAERDEREAVHEERSFEREEDHAEQQFEQQSRHAEQAARREASEPRGDE
jgi:hypothetical protein